MYGSAVAASTGGARNGLVRGSGTLSTLKPVQRLVRWTDLPFHARMILKNFSQSPLRRNQLLNGGGWPNQFAV